MSRRGRPPHPDVLTPREWEVLALLEEGLTNEEIAARLNISRDGAKYHVSEILTKLGLSSREEAARWRRPPVHVLLPIGALIPRRWLPAFKVLSGAVLVASALALALLLYGVLKMGTDAFDNGTNKGYLGVQVRLSGPRDDSLLRIFAIEADGPAATAGLRELDDIRAIDGQAVHTPEGLRQLVEARKPGDRVTLTFVRAGQEQETVVQLAEAPDEYEIETTRGLAPNQLAGFMPPVPNRVMIGLQVQINDPNLKQRYSLARDDGVVVVGLTKYSPADTASVQVGDIVLEVGGKRIRTLASLRDAVEAAPADQPVDVRVQRAAQELALRTAIPARTSIAGLETLSPVIRERFEVGLDFGGSPERAREFAALYDQHPANVRYGVVIAVTETTLQFQPILAQQRDPAPSALIRPTLLGDVTMISFAPGVDVRQGGTFGDDGQPIPLMRLQPGQVVFVLSRDGGQSAFAIYAQGV